MFKKLFSIALASSVAAILAGCYQLDAGIKIGADGLVGGEIVMEFDPSSDFDLSSFEFFNPGEEPDGLIRREIDEPDRQAILLGFEDHPIWEQLTILNPLQDEPFLFLAGTEHNSDMYIRTTSLTKSFCSQSDEEFDLYESLWDVEVTIEFERGVFWYPPEPDRMFTQAVGDGGVIVWRPGFGMDDDLPVVINDPTDSDPRGFDDVFADYEGCGQDPSYRDLAALYPAPSPTPTESQDASEPEATEDAVVEETEEAGADAQTEDDSSEEPVTVDAAADTAEEAQSKSDNTILLIVMAVVILALVGAVIFLAVSRRPKAAVPPTE